MRSDENLLELYDDSQGPESFRRPGQLVPMSNEEYWAKYATDAQCGLDTPEGHRRVVERAASIQEDAIEMGESIAWLDAKALARKTICRVDDGDQTLPEVKSDPPPPDADDNFARMFPPPSTEDEQKHARRMSLAASKALTQWMDSR